MGLATNIEKWDMSAAIGMATEGVRSSYNQGAGGGGFGAADREIASRIDGAKVLAAIDRIGKQAAHLADWSMFAYASPYWNGQQNRERFFNHVLHDWVMSWACKGVYIQERTFNRVKAMLPVIAGGLALEQATGAEISEWTVVGQKLKQELQYQPTATKALLIRALVEQDCLDKGEDSEAFQKKRQRCYQNHWSDWSQHVETIRSQLIQYDRLARKMFKVTIEN
ncbi:hypothetical protein [Photobacterium sp. R1]